MKCPICGKENTLKICYLQQYSYEHKILKNNKISKVRKKVDCGSTEQSILVCENGCNVNDLLWDINKDDTISIIPQIKRYNIYDTKEKKNEY